MNSGWTPQLVAAFSTSSTGWDIRVGLREPDIQPTARHDILFSRAALTQIPLIVLFFSHACGERKKFRTQENFTPRCSCSSFASNPNNFQSVFPDKDVRLVRSLLIERNPWPSSAFKLSWRSTIACACNSICQSLNEYKTCGQAFTTYMTQWERVCVCVCVSERERGRACSSMLEPFAVRKDETHVHDIYYT